MSSGCGQTSQQPLQLNAVNTYEFKGGQILVYKRFRIYLISYIISAIILFYLIIKILKNKTQKPEFELFFSGFRKAPKAKSL